MFLPKLKQSSAYQGLESIKHNLKPRLFKCFQLIRNHKSRDYYKQKVKVTKWFLLKSMWIFKIQQDDCISLEKKLNLLLEEVGYIIEQVLWEHPRPFPLMDFQKLALHQIGSLNNVILVNLTGSGKMLVFVNLRPAEQGLYILTDAPPKVWNDIG